MLTGFAPFYCKGVGGVRQVTPSGERYVCADALSLGYNVIKLVFLNLENLIKILTFAFETFYPFLKDILKHFNKTD